jgi:hypothetical protein
MIYGLTARSVWKSFSQNYQYELAKILHLTTADDIVARSMPKYKEIVAKIEEIKEGGFYLNEILVAAVMASIYMTLDEKPPIEKMIEINKKVALKNKTMQRLAISEKKYTPDGQKKIAKEAEKSMTKTNPYDWKYTYEAGESCHKYSIYYHQCGVVHLYKELGIEELIPAMCCLDYQRANMNNTLFTRESTIAEGAEVCDCHFNHDPR